VLLGLDPADDAGIYRLSDDTALVQTIDFFTPIVDDPRDFGRIAAANALSDVWAMGGRPLCAMNVVCFPVNQLPMQTLREILAGGLDTLKQAGVALVGGHSVEDPELKYGLSVSGLVHPDRFLTTAGARAGDHLVLTKALGTGIVGTAIKANLASPAATRAATDSMLQLNRRAAELMLERRAHAATDVTGFGLVGHALEMLADGQLGLVIHGRSLPQLPEAAEYAGQGLLPAGLGRNRLHYGDRVTLEADPPQAVVDLAHDPQSSGGLLVALGAEDAADLVRILRSEGHAAATDIGEFTSDHPGRLVLRGEA
jgi:selenide,water dikinase